MPQKGRITFDMAGIASVLMAEEYRVPIYQRSYAWTDTAVDDFWSDIRKALDGDEEDYFLGTLVLTLPNKEELRHTIIDGQQRLATTSLLLAAFRDEWEGRSEPRQAEACHRYVSTFDRHAGEDVPRLVLNEDDDEFYRQLVIEKASPTPRRDSHERLANAYGRLSEAVTGDLADHGRRSEARLKKWLDFIDERALVTTVKVPTEADAFVIFETLNARGARLTVGDLLKNYLFMRAERRLDAVRTDWITALTALDMTAEDEEFVSFLRYHWSSKHGAVRERDLYASIRENITTSAQAVTYATELAEAARLFAALHSSSHELWKTSGYTSTTRDTVETLGTLGLEQIQPLLLAVMQHFTPAQIRRTLKAVVSWSIRGLVVGGIGGGRTETAYCNAAVKVRSGAIKDAASLLSELTDIVPEDGLFLDEFKRTRQTRPALARYILLALERTRMKTTEPELVPNKNEDEVNLEHILPRNAKQGDWPSFPSDEVSRWSARLGNLVLLKKTENTRIGNKAWAVKRPKLKTSSLRLTKSAAVNADWTRVEIEARQQELAKLCVATWPRKP